MTAYYNDIDPVACSWIRELQAEGHLPAGKVDERSIKDVKGKDLKGFTEAHFFAGIGGWPLALRLAGWPEGEEVWTGSCPCQPFSISGKAGGVGDARHLWPAFHRLIAKRHPPVIFGEQVESKDGRYWLAGVRTDLEALGYAVGASDLCSAGVSAPHRRQRLYWVADAKDADGRRRERGTKFDDRVGNTSLQGRKGNQRAALQDSGRSEQGRAASQSGETPGVCGVDDPAIQRAGGTQKAVSKGDRKNHGISWEAGPRHCRVGVTHSARRESRGAPGETARYGDSVDTAGFWFESVPIICRDGKYRRVPLEPSLFPLAPGIPGRVGLLRGAGGAITPQVAATFVRAFMEAVGMVGSDKQ